MPQLTKESRTTVRTGCTIGLGMYAGHVVKDALAGPVGYWLALLLGGVFAAVFGILIYWLTGLIFEEKSA